MPIHPLLREPDGAVIHADFEKRVTPLWSYVVIDEPDRMVTVVAV